MLLLSALLAEAPNISQWNAYKESEREREVGFVAINVQQPLMNGTVH